MKKEKRPYPLSFLMEKKPHYTLNMKMAECIMGGR